MSGCAALLATAGAVALGAARGGGRAELRAQVSRSYAELPLSFEENLGQTSDQVRFLARGAGYGLFLTRTGASFLLRSSPSLGTDSSATGRMATSIPPGQETHAMQMVLAGSDPAAPLIGVEPKPGASHYLIGRDPAGWRTGVPHYARVRQPSVYPGIDLVYYGNGRTLEYDFVVSPGADPNSIRIAFPGADALRIDGAGDLVLSLGGIEIRQHAPVVYQERGGARGKIAGRYVLRADEVGFEVAAYDAARPLVIDPVLVYSTYLGGSREDQATDVAVDAEGQAYVVGFAISAEFPTTPGAFQSENIGRPEAFVTKLNRRGSDIVYSTFLGGSSFDVANGIAVDGAGNAYVAGETFSSDFPVTPGAFQPAAAGGSSDGFVAKLDPTGSTLLYSTYLGGGELDSVQDIAVDWAGHAYVVGEARSLDFPVTPGALQPAFGGGLDDAFVAELNRQGSALVYSTYLGGSSSDFGIGIAVDLLGRAHAVGSTGSADFPTSARAVQRSSGGSTDAFVSKLNRAGSALVYSTYLGGSDADVANGIALDRAGRAYVAGTAGVGFPTTANAFQREPGAFRDGFVTKLDLTGSLLSYSTLIGGTAGDGASAIAVDRAGQAHIAGFTVSDDFPVTAGAFQRTKADFSDAYVTKLNAGGSALIYSSFLGGGNNPDEGGSEIVGSIALDAAGDVYVSGSTSSPSFPTTPGAFDRSYGGGSDPSDGAFNDAFVAKIRQLGRP